MPFSGEHSASLIDKKSECIRIHRTKGSTKIKIQGVEIPSSVSIIYYVQNKDGKDIPIPQSLRFPVKNWRADIAKVWLAKNKIKHTEFEPAIPKKKDAENSVPCYSYYVNEAKKQLDIVLHEEIGFWGTQSKEFHQLLNENKDVNVISVDINSPGGSIFHGFSIYEALKSHRAEVKVKVSGVAASIASVIAMSATPGKLEMAESSMMMIHKPIISSMFGADAEALRKQAEALDKMEKNIVAIYKQRADRSEKEIEDMLNVTTWLTADEAKEIGLADKVTDQEDVLNFFDFNEYKYGNIPETVLNSFSIERDDDIEELEIEAPTNEKTGIDKLIDLIKQNFNLKKESKNMADEKLEKQVADQAKEIVDLKAGNETLTAANATLTDTVKNQLDSAESKATDGRKTEFEAFCDKLVVDGIIKPADIDTHADTMELKFQADKAEFKDGKTETPKLDAFKKVLSNMPVSVPVGDRHVANKDAVADSKKIDAKDPLDVAARKIMSENKGMAYRDAVAQAYEADPSLYDVDQQIVKG